MPLAAIANGAIELKKMSLSLLSTRLWPRLKITAAPAGRGSHDGTVLWCAEAHVMGDDVSANKGID